jgi:hypothetical protein
MTLLRFIISLMVLTEAIDAVVMVSVSAEGKSEESRSAVVRKVVGKEIKAMANSTERQVEVRRMRSRDRIKRDRQTHSTNSSGISRKKASHTQDLPDCVGDSQTWESGFGECSTYAEDFVGEIPSNHAYCTDTGNDPADQVNRGKAANDVCAECGACSGETTTATTATTTTTTTTTVRQPLQECKVTVYEHWPAGLGEMNFKSNPSLKNNPALADLKLAMESWHYKFPTGNSAVLSGVKEHKLPNKLKDKVSSIKVEGACCKARGFTDDDCTVSTPVVDTINASTVIWDGLTQLQGIVTPARKLRQVWGCNDCTKCIKVTQKCSSYSPGQLLEHGTTTSQTSPTSLKDRTTKKNTTPREGANDSHILGRHSEDEKNDRRLKLELEKASSSHSEEEQIANARKGKSIGNDDEKLSAREVRGIPSDHMAWSDDAAKDYKKRVTDEKTGLAEELELEGTSSVAQNPLTQVTETRQDLDSAVEKEDDIEDEVVAADETDEEIEKEPREEVR